MPWMQHPLLKDCACGSGHPHLNSRCLWCLASGSLGGGSHIGVWVTQLFPFILEVQDVPSELCLLSLPAPLVGRVRDRLVTCGPHYLHWSEIQVRVLPGSGQMLHG